MSYYDNYNSDTTNNGNNRQNPNYRDPRLANLGENTNNYYEYSNTANNYQNTSYNNQTTSYNNPSISYSNQSASYNNDGTDYNNRNASYNNQTYQNTQTDYYGNYYQQSSAQSDNYYSAASYNPPTNTTDRYIYDLSYPEENPSELDLKTDQELWLETWLSRLGKIQINLDSTIVNLTTNPAPKQPKPHANKLRLNDAKNCLRKSLAIMTRIEGVQQELRENVERFSSEEWKCKTEQIGVLRDELSVLMAPFEERGGLVGLRATVRGRRKKRRGQRRRRVVQREWVREREEERRGVHEVIDGWLEREKDEVQRVKESEAMQRDADSLLTATLTKLSSSRRHLSLIHSLSSLRATRLLQPHYSHLTNTHTTAHDTVAFNSLAERLTTTWQRRIALYGREEDTMRVMLEREVEGEVREARRRREAAVVGEWKGVLFGEDCDAGKEREGLYWGLTAAERDVETFVAIRKSWDTFLSQTDDENSSKIPLGWIIPPSENTSDKWQQYLTYN